MSIDDIRARLDRIEAERINPFIRIRTDELREILDALDDCEDENAALFRAAQKNTSNKA